ncbi:MAG: NfeD family protein [Pseudomonadota bacterium]
MVDFLIGLGPFTWWIVGAVLLSLEILAPGTILLWFGIAAIVVGAIALVVDWPWQAEMALFGALSVASILVSRRYLKRPLNETDQPFLNQRAEAFVGREFILIEAIAQGSGKVKVDDTVWRVGGPDLPEGTRVRVVGADGSRLQVEPAAAD